MLPANLYKFPASADNATEMINPKNASPIYINHESCSVSIEKQNTKHSADRIVKIADNTELNLFMWMTSETCICLCLYYKRF